MITIKDLADQIYDKKRADEFLYCSECGTRFSAHSGDYYFMKEFVPLVCNRCNVPFVLAKEEVSIKIIKK